ncbi:hypothetical protein HYFRA_00011412 [Hymenoscyphus fraxineus]|uniref:Fucose-specific lectin n=1 Tax=Hymenoscyphus fraxineus TaxID=746836 RepID=A0A9N9L0D7_9HELO|nr:hypothetical protein HYFRA_00011412 [Hymenoscyphus fraxineus]
MYFNNTPRPSTAPERSREPTASKQKNVLVSGGSIPYGEIFRPKELKQEDQKFRGFCRDQSRGHPMQEPSVESQHNLSSIVGGSQQLPDTITQSIRTTSDEPPVPHSPTDLEHSGSSSQTQPNVSPVTPPNIPSHQRQTSTENHLPLIQTPIGSSVRPTGNLSHQSPDNHTSVLQNQAHGHHSPPHSPTSENNFQRDLNGNILYYKPFTAYDLSPAMLPLPPPLPWTHRLGNRTRPLQPPPGLWRWIFLSTFVGLIAIAAAFAVRESTRPSPLNEDTVTVADITPTEATLAFDSFDVEDSIMGTYFSPPAERPQSFMVYGASLGRICIRNRLNGTWSPTEKCVENANPKPGTSFSIVDWLGGPTIAFITTDNFLSTLNHIPAKENETWALSTLVDDKVPAHPSSKLASVTWTNGTALWLMYQGPNGQIREYGLDDFRNRKFRPGSHGDIAPALNGTFLSAARYDATEELCYQSTNTQINCRRYANGVWGNDDYVISSTESGLPAHAAFSMTMMTDPGTKVDTLLAVYAKSNGAVNLVTRSSVGINSTNIGSFSSPVQISECKWGR